jgi:mono/diheme cytochrome c family protein
MRDNLCEDPPAWWLLHKKQTMYHTGSADARSVRSIMQFMMSPLNPASAFPRNEATFADIQQFIYSLRPPKYPLPIDRGLAEQGEKLFVKTCARCHGTYGEQWTYPNKVIPLDEIGTDATRYHGISEEFGHYYNQSWFAQEKTGWLVDGYPARHTKGYQAPPLDGIWATAPYFHNGSAPTVADVLNSKTRPKIFTRSYRTDQESYDSVKLGWKVQVLERGPDPKLSDYERRKIYDTTQTGRGNGGHTFGDHLSDAERRAVIEYLKTL